MPVKAPSWCSLICRTVSVLRQSRFTIRLAPFGILGLVADTIATTGFSALASYGQLIAVLLGAMAIIAFVVNPLLVFLKTGSNPYPLVFTCLRESGVTAFFTRSSAANIPVNLQLCRKAETQRRNLRCIYSAGRDHQYGWCC